VGDDGQASAAAESRPRATSGSRTSLPPAAALGHAAATPHRRIASACSSSASVIRRQSLPSPTRPDAARKGIPFDVLGADFGHHGEDCTFETLGQAVGIKDRRSGDCEIVHEADLHDGKFTVTKPRAWTWRSTASLRPRRTITSARARMAIFEGLHTVLKQKT